MDIIAALNSGKLHAAARTANPECVDAKGNVHHSEKRAKFVDYRNEVVAEYGDDHNAWPREVKREYRKLYAK